MGREAEREKAKEKRREIETYTERQRQTDRERGGRVILEHRIPIFLVRLIFQF